MKALANEIRDQIAARETIGDLSQRQLAATFGVSQSSVSRIVRQRRGELPVIAKPPREMDTYHHILTADQVREVWRLVEDGSATYRSIGRQFGVSHVQIWNIAHKRRWAHLNLESREAERHNL